MLFPAILVTVVLAVFSPCLGFGFLNWDDYQHFYSNPCVYGLSWYNLCNLFQQAPNHTYIPLTILSFNLEYHLFGLSPFAAHLINVLLHGAVVVLIYNFALQLEFSVWEAFIAALIFAVHPLHVESVAWVTERKDVLSVLFYVLCLKQYWSYLGNRSGKNYVLSVVFGFLSILAKPMAVSIPWILLLLDWYYQRRPSKTLWLDKLPYAVLILPIALITVFKLSPHPDVGYSSLLIGFWSFSWYLEKLLLPFNLLPAYTPPVPVVLSNFIYLKSLVIFIIFIALMFLRRRDRLFIFACLFWLGTIFFFWRFDFRDSNIVADRFMYLPSLGFCLWLGRYLSKFKVLVSVLAVILGLMTFNQCHIWRDDLTLWAWTLEHDPKNVIAKENESGAIFNSRRKGADYKALTEAMDKNPFNAKIYFERGEALFNEQDYYLAFSDLNQAIKIDPAYGMAYIRRGQLYVLSGDFERALEDFYKAIALKPDNALAYLQGSVVFESMRDSRQALAWLDKAAQIDPSMEGIYYQRGRVYYDLGQYRKAIDEFTRSIPLHSGLKNSYYYRARSYAALNQFGPAQEDYARALREDPYDLKILNESGDLYLRQGNYEKALEVFNKVIAMYPYYDNAYNNRGIIHIYQKQYALALKDYTDAIRLALYPYHALITRGDIYFVMGEKKKALEDYDTAVLFSNGDPIAKMKRDHLEEMNF